MQTAHSLLHVTNIHTDIETFLSGIGRIVTVFDKQDSGCVSYGVEVSGEKWFVKQSDQPEGIRSMKNAAELNSAVKHRCLPSFRNAFCTLTGFALVYNWVEGEVLNSPDYRDNGGRNNPNSPHYRFRQLPLDRIIRMLNQIYELHVFLESEGYVAVDFYDGAIIYDFARDETHVCDLDHFVKGQFSLEEDRLPGSTRFMAPEEFVKGSVIDHRTNVYTMGAAAFVFLADSHRTEEQWRASMSLFEVAKKAVSDDRDARFDSVHSFYDAWRAALR